MAHKHLCGLALISLHVIIISSINCLLRKFHLMPQSGWRTLFVLLEYIMLIGSEHSEHELICQFSSVQSLSHVWLFATLWTAAHKASLSITNSWSLPKLISTESVMPSDYLILCHPFSSRLQSFPASGSFQMSQFFTSGGQSIGVSVSTSVLPVTAQDWSPLGWTGWISLQSKGLSKVFANTMVQKHQFFGAQNWFVVCN